MVAEPFRVDRSRAWAVLLVLTVFVGTVGGTWAWFRTGVDRSSASGGIWVSARTNVAGYAWQAEPISADAAAILDATTLLNGRLTSTNSAVGALYTVFTAEWLASASKSLNVARHTPDVCWVGAGWRPVNLGAPRHVEIEIPLTRHAHTESGAPAVARTVQLPFQCRSFRAPGSSRTEVVIWCALLNGIPVAEGTRWGIEDDSDVDPIVRIQTSARRSALSQFLQSVRRRIPGNRSKQFLRISRASGPDVARTVQELLQFTGEVLSADAAVLKVP